MGLLVLRRFCSLPKSRFKIKVLVDLDCKICNQEVCMLKKTDVKKHGENTVEFVNIAYPGYRPEDHCGITYKEAMENIHVITAEDKVSHFLFISILGEAHISSMTLFQMAFHFTSKKNLRLVSSYCSLL